MSIFKTKLSTKILILFILGFLFFVFKFLQKNNSSPTANKESCLSCHANVKGFSPAHNPEIIGCTACHLGNPKSSNKTIAHTKMIAIPGNLSDVSQTCSTASCHVGIDLRVKNSLMNTMSGIIAVDKFIFDESNDLNAIHHVENLGYSAADTHLRQMCASCHLGKERNTTGPINELTRGGGCNACHLNYDEASNNAHTKYINSDKTILPTIHPSLSLNITNEHCFGCHSRSGRISTNYEGWHELPKNKIVDTSSNKIRQLLDKRFFKFIQADVHHELGMSCIDCHNATEVMGNGNIYAHQEEAVKIVCQDCHSNNKPTTLAFSELDLESQKIIELRNFPKNKNYVVGSVSNEAMINVFFEENKRSFKGKNNGKEFELSAPSEICQQYNSHKNLSCETCHTSWAPQCVSCHISYDPNKTRFDLLSQKEQHGKWIEKGDLFFSDYPTLGIVENDELKKIKTFIQGMNIHLDKSAFTKKEKDIIHKRSFALSAPHTISAKGQTCKTCHHNPVALGYGRGMLSFNKNGNKHWSFIPKLAIQENDSLPIDAWIGFLSNTKNAISTRTNTRPFLLEEQQKILSVGACLTCHKDNSTVAKLMLADFEKAKANQSNQCLAAKYSFD